MNGLKMAKPGYVPPEDPDVIEKAIRRALADAIMVRSVAASARLYGPSWAEYYEAIAAQSVMISLSSNRDVIRIRGR